jgi:hypothetical protein
MGWALLVLRHAELSRSEEYFVQGLALLMMAMTAAGFFANRKNYTVVAAIDGTLLALVAYDCAQDRLEAFYEAIKGALPLALALLALGAGVATSLWKGGVLRGALKKAKPEL